MKLATSLFCAAFALGTLPAIAATTAGSSTPPSCPGDQPVWVNTKSKAYHLATDPLYGKTKHGVYLCKAAADAAGDHLAKGGKGGMSTSQHQVNADTTKAATTGSGSSVSPSSTDAPAPLPTATGKHHHHHHGMASPSPAAT